MADDNRGRPAVAEEFLEGGGGMGELIRAHDWSRTPVGPIEAWPQSLLTAASICLKSRFPIVLYWGPEYLVLYNDAYSQILSGKHPWALGKPCREVWAEIWDTIGPMLDGVVASGDATWSEDELLILERHGYSEECYFTFSFSPVQVESGAIGGIFTAVAETTDKVIGQRRLGTIRELAERAGAARTEADAGAAAVRVLADNRVDLPFALLYLLSEDGSEARLISTAGLEGNAPARRGSDSAPERRRPEAARPEPRAPARRGSDSAPERGRPEAAHPEVRAAGSPAVRRLIDIAEPACWPLAQVVNTGVAERVENLGTRCGELPAGKWDEPPHTALVLPVPMPGQERTRAILVAGVSPRRSLDDNYRSFFDLVVGQIGTAIANARAREQEHERAEKLAELDRTKTAFFSNVSHEFRTPLTLMLGPLQDVIERDGDALAPHIHEALDVAQRNGFRLLRLVNTLLDFSTIEAGRIDASYEATDLPGFTAELASMFRSAMEKAGLRLVVDMPELTEPVYVDRELWEKIVMNLLSNAFKFTFAGEVVVRLRREGRYVELEVSDTGCGIPEQEIPHLFERFHRIRGARSRTHEGSGIGLALVDDLVKLHGGSVRVTSTEGRGSTFRVSIPTGTAHLPAERIGSSRGLAATMGGAPYVDEALRWLAGAPLEPGAFTELPVEPVEDALNTPMTGRSGDRGSGRTASGRPRSGAESQPRRAGDRGSGRAASGGQPSGAESQPRQAGERKGMEARILVADDNVDMREYLRRLLGAQWTVDCVADGAAALAAAREHPPDLMLADVMMPGLGGFELLRELRADPVTREIPVLMLSARAGEESRVEGLKAGADDYLVKPFSARELLARVGAHLELARVRREAGRALRESEERFRVLVEAAPLGVYLVDQDFRISHANPIALPVFGGIPNMIGRDFDEVIHVLWSKPYADEIVRLFRHTLESGESYVTPERIEHRRDRGVIEIYEWRIDRIPLPDGRCGVVCYFRDISERVLARHALEIARAEAEEANRTKARFLATMSHELRTPLNAILGYTDLLEAGVAGPITGGQRQQLGGIEKGARHLIQLIEEILTFARVEAGKEEVRPVDVNAAEVAHDTAALIEPLALAKGLGFHMTLATLSLNTDPARLGQILLNLLSNAVKFTEKGEVRLDVSGDGDEILFAVTDTGIGIPPDDMERVFEPFHQATPSVAQPLGGTGLGLSVSRQLARLLGGDITLESTVGAGSIFSLRLPRNRPSRVVSDEPKG